MNETTVKVQLNENYKKSAEMFGDYGWIIPMDLPPYSPVEICENPNAINQIMANYYNNDIRFTNMVCELLTSKIAKKHRVTILQSYCAYKMNLFSVCISSLNPLYEGLLSVVAKEKKTHDLKKILGEIKSIHYDDQDESPLNQGVENIYFNLEAFFKKYTTHQSFERVQDEYSRHNIAHGRIYISDDQIQAIKIFSNLYNMAVFFSDYVDEKQECI